MRRASSWLTLHLVVWYVGVIACWSWCRERTWFVQDGTIFWYLISRDYPICPPPFHRRCHPPHPAFALGISLSLTLDAKSLCTSLQVTSKYKRSCCCSTSTKRSGCWHTYCGQHELGGGEFSVSEDSMRSGARARGTKAKPGARYLSLISFVEL